MEEKNREMRRVCGLHIIYSKFTEKWFEILHGNHTMSTTG